MIYSDEDIKSYFYQFYNITYVRYINYAIEQGSKIHVYYHYNDELSIPKIDYHSGFVFAIIEFKTYMRNKKLESILND